MIIIIIVIWCSKFYLLGAEYKKEAEVENNSNVVASKPNLEYVSEFALSGYVYVWYSISRWRWFARIHTRIHSCIQYSNKQDDGIGKSLHVRLLTQTNARQADNNMQKSYEIYVDSIYRWTQYLLTQ